jgi:molybdenum cofactor cytidylyltransferase
MKLSFSIIAPLHQTVVENQVQVGTIDMDTRQTYSTAALVLAAGTSSRMEAGRHKLLLPLGDRPVIAHVVDAALASQARPILIVAGYRAEALRAALGYALVQPGVMLLENAEYRQGMSSSLKLGIQKLQEINRNFVYSSNICNKSISDHFIDSAVVLLGDQPLITQDIIDALIAARGATGKRIIAPLYQGQRGHPLLFAADLFTEFMQIDGDEGGRSVIVKHRAEMATIERPEIASQQDVDTWEAYQKVVELWREKQEQARSFDTE